MTIEMLPLGTTREIVKNNLRKLEEMLAAGNKVREDEKTWFESLTPEEKRREVEGPSLEDGFERCPICEVIPRPRWSLSEGYEIHCVFVYNYDKSRNAEFKAKLDSCPEHGPSSKTQSTQRFWNVRFKTFEEMVNAWNASLPKSK